MSLPPPIEMALRLGKDLAAEVACVRVDWRAWVWVHPVMKSGKSWKDSQEQWTRSRRGAPYDDTIASYRVRYIELSEWHLQDEWLQDLDIAIEQRPIVDKSFKIENVEALVELLSTWLPDLALLTAPALADYPEPPLS